MAVPYEGGVPQERPDVRSPDDYLHVQAGAESFGGLIAHGTEKLGAGATTAGHFFGQVAADNAYNDFQSFGEKLLHGDPNKQIMGPDGKPTPDLGFSGLKGRAALDARPGVEKQLDDKLKEIREGLPTPEMGLRFDEFSRRYRAVLTSQIGTHTDTQANSWYADVEKSSANLALRHIATSAVNPNMTEQQRGVEIQNGENDLIHARIKTVQRMGAQPGDEVWNQAYAQAREDGLKARLEAISVKEPERALKILEDNKDVAGVHYHTLAGEFRNRALHKNAIAGGDQAIIEERQSTVRLASAPQTPIAGLPAWAVSGIRNEEGYDTVPRWDVRQWTVGYGSKASGPNERPDDAEKERRFQTDIGRESRTVDAVNPNLDAGTRAALVSLTHQTGDKWTRAGLGDAIRAGDLAKARELFLQYNHVEGPDGQLIVHPAVAERRAREVQWFGQEGAPPGATKAPGTDIPSLRAGAVRRIMGSDKPFEEKQLSIAHVNQLAMDARIASESETRMRKERSDAAVSEYLERAGKKDYGGIGGAPPISQQILSDARIEPAARHTWAQFFAHASGDAGQLVNFGPGWEAAKRGALSAPGTAGHIADPAEIALRSLPGGDLTPAGAHDIVQAMTLAKKSPDEFGLQQTKMSLQAYAKSKLSFEQDTGPIKIRDSKGEQLFSGTFVPRFNKLYADWIASGKSGHDFLTKENVDKLITPLRSKADRDADFLRATGEGRAEAGEPAGAIPTAPAGADAFGWKEIVGHPPTTAGGKAWPYAAWASTVNFLRANPTPENIKQFNDKFAGSGYKAEEIIGALSGKKIKREADKTIEERSTEAGFPPFPETRSIFDVRRYVPPALNLQ